MSVFRTLILYSGVGLENARMNGFGYSSNLGDALVCWHLLPGDANVGQSAMSKNYLT